MLIFNTWYCMSTVYSKAQHSMLFTMKSSRPGSGLLSKVATVCDRPWLKFESSHSPNLPSLLPTIRLSRPARRM